MPKRFRTSDDQFRGACADFWLTYYQSMKELHARQRRRPHEPLKDRNLGTTTAKHIVGFESFWRQQLSGALGIDPSDVGPRKIKFRPYRSKTFDVCWPLKGEPKILISIKSMQNAYRNLTNRVEEALGDSAILRLYKLPSVFGFFFFMLDGKVARGLAEQGKPSVTGDEKSGGGKGVAPFLEPIEEGGDFFQLSRMDEHRKEPTGASRPRQSVISITEQSLVDMLATTMTKKGRLHYDSIAFAPTTVKRLTKNPKSAKDWSFDFSIVDQRLDFHTFVGRLIDVAKYRAFI